MMRAASKEPALSVPAANLLLMAARKDFSPNERDRFRALAGAVKEPEWPRLAEKAAAFRVSGLLHRHLSAHGPSGGVPAAVRFALAKTYRAETVRGLCKYSQLGRIVDAAAGAGIDLLLLKGAYLAHWVYGNLGLRAFDDIDLLSRPADIPALTRLLQGLGYAQDSADAKSRIHARLQADVFQHLLPFHKPGCTSLEVHSAPTTAHLEAGYPVAEIWRRARSLDWDGRKVFVLSNEDLMVHLSAHLAYHLDAGLIRLIWFCDIREVVRRAALSLDWGQVWSMAGALGLEDAVGGAWRLLGSAWDVSIPAGILPLTMRPGAELDLPHLLARASVGPSPGFVHLQFTRSLRLRHWFRTPRDRRRFLWKQAFPDPAFIRKKFRIPAGKSAFFCRSYYLIHNIRAFVIGFLRSGKILPKP